MELRKNRLRHPLSNATASAHTEVLLDKFGEFLKALEQEMDRLIEQDDKLREEVRLMKTVLGVGPTTSRVLAAEFGSLSQYRRNELVALTGLYPARFESGTSVWKRPQITKTGNAHVRRALYMAALSAMRYCPSLRAVAERLKKRGLAPKAVIVAVMRRLLILIHRVVLSGKKFKTA